MYKPLVRHHHRTPGKTSTHLSTLTTLPFSAAVRGRRTAMGSGCRLTALRRDTWRVSLCIVACGNPSFDKLTRGDLLHVLHTIIHLCIGSRGAISEIESVERSATICLEGSQGVDGEAIALAERQIRPLLI